MAHVEEEYAYTSDWISAVTLGVESLCFNVIIAPKILWFDVTVHKAVYTLRAMGVEPILAKLEASLARAGLVRIPGVILASMYIEEWVQNRSPTPRNLSTTAHTVYAAISNIVESFRGTEGLGWVTAEALTALKPLLTNPATLLALTQPVLEEPE